MDFVTSEIVSCIITYLNIFIVDLFCSLCLTSVYITYHQHKNLSFSCINDRLTIYRFKQVIFFKLHDLIPSSTKLYFISL